MKQITILQTRNGLIIKSDNYYVNNMDFFLADTLNKYIEVSNKLETLIGNNIKFNIIIQDIAINDNYDLFKFIRERTKNKEITYNNVKTRLEKLANYSKKHR